MKCDYACYACVWHSCCLFFQQSADPLLDKMLGHWTMNGKLLGQPTTHTVEAKWILNHQFLKIHGWGPSEIPRLPNRNTSPGESPSRHKHITRRRRSAGLPKLRTNAENPKIWLQSRRIATANGTAADDDEPCGTGCFTNPGIHRAGNSPARSTGESQRRAASTNEINFNLPDQDRETRGLSRARRRCRPRKRGHLERPVPLDRHRVGLRPRS